MRHRKKAACKKDLTGAIMGYMLPAMTQTKPRFRVVANRLVRVDDGTTPIERARIKYGRPFAHQAGTEHVHTAGAAYWTPERINALAIDNAKRRERK